MKSQVQRHQCTAASNQPLTTTIPSVAFHKAHKIHGGSIRKIRFFEVVQMFHGFVEESTHKHLIALTVCTKGFSAGKEAARCANCADKSFGAESVAVLVRLREDCTRQMGLTTLFVC